MKGLAEFVRIREYWNKVDKENIENDKFKIIKHFKKIIKIL